MIDLVKKAMFTGMGILSLSKDKVEEVAQELVEKGEMTKQEGQKFVGELLKKSEESKEELKKQTEATVQSIMDKMDLASKDDIAALKLEIEQLKEMMDVNKKQ